MISHLSRGWSPKKGTTVVVCLCCLTFNITGCDDSCESTVKSCNFWHQNSYSFAKLYCVLTAEFTLSWLWTWWMKFDWLIEYACGEWNLIDWLSMYVVNEIWLIGYVYDECTEFVLFLLQDSLTDSLKCTQKQQQIYLTKISLYTVLCRQLEVWWCLGQFVLNMVFLMKVYTLLCRWMHIRSVTESLVAHNHTPGGKRQY